MNESEDLNETIRNLSRDLRRYAAGMLKRCPSDLTIQATDLVNMAFLKIHQKEQLATEGGDGEIFGLYVTTMKNLLRDHLRTRRRLRRGGRREKVQLDIVQGLEAANVEPLAFMELLDELEAMGEERKVKVAVARVLYRLTNEEIAHQLGVSVSTVEDDMRKTREWLKHRLFTDE